jgi:hypothetical protein
MPSILDFVLYSVLGQRMMQGIGALKAINGIPSLIHLVDVLSQINCGIRIPLSEDEIKRGLDELKTILNMRVDSRSDIDEQQKALMKMENGFCVDGCYQEIMKLLGQNGYTTRYI